VAWQNKNRFILQRVILQHEIEQFYYHEAELLDGREFYAWLDLLSEDLEYWMPIRMVRTSRESDLEFSKFGGHAYYDDDKELMTTRVKKLYTGCSWGEDPPSRTRHLICNVMLSSITSEDEINVVSNFNIYQSRLSDEENFWYGQRKDLLRKSDGKWEIVRRHIFLDHVRLSSKSLTIFF